LGGKMTTKVVTAQINGTSEKEDVEKKKELKS